MPKPFQPRRVALTLACTGLAALALPIGLAAAATPVPPPVGGHGQVVAQGVVTFADGPVQWTTASEVLSNGAPAVPAGGAAPTFLAVTSGALVVSDAETPLARVAAGEAWYAPAGSEATAAPGDGLDVAVEVTAELAPREAEYLALAG